MKEVAFSRSMETKIRTKMKRAVVSIPLKPVASLEKICWGLRFRSWLKDQWSATAPYFNNRLDLYRHINDGVLRAAAVDFLEFGVCEGASIRAWMRLNENPNSRFFGFDTFQGLPEEWRHFGCVTPKGVFSTGGRVPDVKGDSRVSWISGLFQETLPGFLTSFSPQNALVVHLDADLYSSTLYVLTALNQILTPGSIILFDEFSSFDNEFRAFGDFTAAFRRSYRMLACGGDYYDKVAIQF